MLPRGRRVDLATVQPGRVQRPFPRYAQRVDVLRVELIVVAHLADDVLHEVEVDPQVGVEDLRALLNGHPQQAGRLCIGRVGVEVVVILAGVARLIGGDLADGLRVDDV